jgi:chitin disaccharide deacetylase
MHMKPILFLVIILFTYSLSACGQKTTAEKLGYPKDTKLLIIHADDLGVSHSENMATIQSMEKGQTNSASIMVPTPWFSEIAAWSAAHPKADFGLHLVLTSEWKYYKWRPLSDEVPGLANKEGFFYASVDSVYQHASLQEVEKELRKQIEKAKQFGVDFTHFDSHMGALFGREDYFKLLIKLGREYKVPILRAKTGPRSDEDLNSDANDKDVFLDAVFTANPNDFKGGMENFYIDVLKKLQPGLNEIIMHVAYDNDEMQAVTIDHPDWGAAWRQADYNFFTSEKCRKMLKDLNIQLVTWRELRDKIVRK